ncbi:hypothetical protein [Streptomyces sp.]|uniref:hypothetical protein n=1 Tax=Streptomyces sp. TaxID=1931 RepID=UPI002F94E4A6
MTAPAPVLPLSPVTRFLDALCRLAIHLLSVVEVQLEAELITATAANQQLKEGP